MVFLVVITLTALMKASFASNSSAVAFQRVTANKEGLALKNSLFASLFINAGEAPVAALDTLYLHRGLLTIVQVYVVKRHIGGPGVYRRAIGM